MDIINLVILISFFALTARELGGQHETYLGTIQENRMCIPDCWSSWLYYFLNFFFVLVLINVTPLFRISCTFESHPVLLWRKSRL